MKGRQSPPLKYILVVHNLFLSTMSALVAIFMISVLLSFIQEKNYSLFHVYCAGMVGVFILTAYLYLFIDFYQHHIIQKNKRKIIINH